MHLLDGHQLVIDGKQLRSTRLPGHQRQAPVQLVSVWPAERRVWVSRPLDRVEETTNWAGLSTLVCVQTWRWKQGREERSTRYYLSSLTGASAAQLADYVRGHWGIENQLHWHLDVTFAERPAAADKGTPRATWRPCGGCP